MCQVWLGVLLRTLAPQAFRLPGFPLVVMLQAGCQHMVEGTQRLRLGSRDPGLGHPTCEAPKHIPGVLLAVSCGGRSSCSEAS